MNVNFAHDPCSQGFRPNTQKLLYFFNKPLFSPKSTESYSLLSSRAPDITYWMKTKSKCRDWSIEWKLLK